MKEINKRKAEKGEQPEMKMKSIAVLLLTVMIFSLLSACAEGSAAGPAESGAHEETLSEAAGPESSTALAEETAAGKPDFDYDAFFRAYADLWCSKMTPYMAAYYAEEDVHPLKYLRINVVVQQFDEFLDTYGIREGDNMYLAPEDRVRIW